MNAMILAAGRGERLRPLTDAVPKPLLEIGSAALIEYHLKALALAGVERVVINVSWLAGQIVARVGDGRQFGVQVIFSDEGPVALETAGGIVKALPLLGTAPFWVVNGDVYTDFGFAPLQLAARSVAHLLVVPNPEHNRSGDFGLEDGHLINPSCGTDALEPPPYTYCGIGVFRPECFDGCSPGPAPLAPLLRRFAGQRRVQGTVYGGLWDDIGTTERLALQRKNR